QHQDVARLHAGRLEGGLVIELDTRLVEQGHEMAVLLHAERVQGPLEKGLHLFVGLVRERLVRPVEGDGDDGLALCEGLHWVRPPRGYWAKERPSLRYPTSRGHVNRSRVGPVTSQPN